VAAASVGAIRRALLRFAEQGAERFLGEPSLELADLPRRDGQGCGEVAQPELVLVFDEAHLLFDGPPPPRPQPSG
jgi:hypothetical protein